MDRRLAQVAWLGGDDYTIADVASFPWVARWPWHGLDHGLRDYPERGPLVRRDPGAARGAARLRRAAVGSGDPGAVSRLDHPAVRRVRSALREKGSRAEVIELEATARTAEDAARSLGVAVGAIVKSLLFTIDGDPVMALVAGDRRCDTRALAPAFGRSGLVLRADPERVLQATGFVIGGVAPLGHRRRCRPRSTTASVGSRRSTPPPGTLIASFPPRSWS